MGFADVAEQQNCGIKEVSLVLIALEIAPAKLNRRRGCPGARGRRVLKEPAKKRPTSAWALIVKETAGSSTALV